MNPRFEKDFELPGLHVEEWEDLAVDFLAGDLPENARRAVEAHLESCNLCRQELERQESLLRLMEPHRPVSPPPALTAAVFTSLEEADVFSRQAQPLRRDPASGRGVLAAVGDFLRRTRGAAWVPAAAAVFLVAVALSQLGDGFPGGADMESAALREESSATSASAEAESGGAYGAQQDTSTMMSVGTETTSGDDAAGGGDLQKEISPPSFDQGRMATAATTTRVFLVEQAGAEDQAGTASSRRFEDRTGLVSQPPEVSGMPGPAYVAFIAEAELDALREHLAAAGLQLTELSGDVAEEQKARIMESAATAPLLLPPSSAWEIVPPQDLILAVFVLP